MSEQIRNRWAHLRLNEDKAKALDLLISRLGEMSRSRVLRKMILEATGQGPDLLKDDLISLREAVRQIAALGRNISQIARAVNSGQLAGLPFNNDLLNAVARQVATLEKDTGEILAGPEQQKELAANWAIDFDTRKRSRDTANIVFSMPRGSKVEALRQAVRKTGSRAFPEHEWVFAIHEDKDHPHAHMMVKMRDWKGEKKLRLRKGDLYRLRELFAEAAREEGVRLAASPRAARGIWRKGERLEAYHMRQRGIVPRAGQRPAQETEQEVRSKAQKRKAWQRAVAERHAMEKETYAECVLMCQSTSDLYLQYLVDCEKIMRSLQIQ